MKLNKLLVIIAFLLAGCIKTTTKEIIRKDQSLAYGNRGYIYGTAPPAPERIITKKKIIEIEVELPPFPAETKPYRATIDKEIWGNQGYIYRAQPEEFKIYLQEKPATPQISLPPVEEKPAEKLKQPLQPEPVSPRCITKEEEQPEYIIYRVKEGESLWKIAKKIYGDANKWVIIYEENKNKIKDPGYIKPGLELRIPLSAISGEKEIK